MDTYLWTRHSEWKMKQYSLSQQRLKRVIRNPERVEKSIVPGMIASMQVGGTSKNRYEIWVMYEITKQKEKSEEQREGEWSVGLENATTTFQKRNFQGKMQNMSPAAKFREMRRKEFMEKRGIGGKGKVLRIISAWKYPGESPERDPIPVDILEELRDLR